MCRVSKCEGGGHDNTEKTPLCIHHAPLGTHEQFIGFLIAARDMDAGNVSVRLHGKGNVSAKPKAEVIAQILTAIRERKHNFQLLAE